MCQKAAQPSSAAATGAACAGGRDLAGEPGSSLLPAAVRLCTAGAEGLALGVPIALPLAEGCVGRAVEPAVQKRTVGSICVMTRRAFGYEEAVDHT